MAFSLSGAMSGLGGAMEQAGRDMLQASLQEQRDRRLIELQQRAALETHRAKSEIDIGNIPARADAETSALVRRGDALRPGEMETARGKAEIEVEKQNELPYTLAPGQRRNVGERTIASAPEKEMPQEQRDYYAAAANRLNREAQAIADGTRYRAGGSTPKPALPKITKSKDDDGKEILLDTTSGAVGTIEPGQAFKKGEWRLFGPNDPDTPATGPTIKWHAPDGKPLPNGLADLYPELAARTPGRSAEPPPVAGARKAPDGNWYVEREGRFLRVDPAQSGQETAPAQRPAPQSSAPRGLAQVLDEQRPRPRRLIRDAISDYEPMQYP